MIANVIFDVALVIVDWDPTRLSAFVGEERANALATSEAFAEINHNTDQGQTLADAMADFDARYPDLAPVYRAYVEHFPVTVAGEMPGTSAIVRELIAAGVPTFGLSNWADENFHVAEAAAPVLGELRDLVVSARVGLAKPDPAIFELALRRFGVAAEETVMIDDTVRNLDAAESVGLRTLHFTSADALRRDLRALGLLR
ncbi:HAD family hydrolase [Nigerium massiliense]|uniref:HAD family hydrolase n=1 Tax=Nigerium massiliense TaxID=1522317 RepID=UPI00058E96E3|nr:HAD family phosphatase [Nigerium massiliense]